LWIVSDGSANADDDDIDQRAQAMQVLNARRTIDILRMASRRRHSAIERLAELTNDNEVVDGPVPQGSKQLSPALRQGLLPPAKKLDKAFPRVGTRNFSGRKIAQFHGGDQIRGSLVINATIGHSILKIHLISRGMILDFRCFMNAPSKRRFSK
jgi:hypothetical protein